MSWTTYKSTIEAVLTGSGLREIPENKTPEQVALSHNHNAFSLKFGGIGDNSTLTNKGMLTTHSALIEVRYKNINSDARDVNADNFYTLLTEFVSMANFLGFDEMTFEDLDNKHSIGKITFQVGVDGC